MGRVRVQIKKIENKTYRHITFAKRKSGLVKKAYEISTLCDVEVALIIFSPAGKLILFEGKKRLDEILTHFIDLPHHQSGRLRDQELVRRIVAQMSLEAELRRHLASCNSDNSDRDGTKSVDAQLEEIGYEISKHSAELEEVERQLQYFLKSPSCIKSVNEAEFLEGVFEETLKLVSIHKQVLEANNIHRTNSERRPMHPQSAGASGFITGSSNYCLGNWPQQYAASSSSRSEFDGCIRKPPYDKLFNNADFSQGMSNIQQGRKSADNEPNKVVNATVARRGSCSQNRHRGLPFPY